MPDHDKERYELLGFHVNGLAFRAGDDLTNWSHHKLHKLRKKGAHPNWSINKTEAESAEKSPGLAESASITYWFPSCLVDFFARRNLRLKRSWAGRPSLKSNICELRKMLKLHSTFPSAVAFRLASPNRPISCTSLRINNSSHFDNSFPNLRWVKGAAQVKRPGTSSVPWFGGKIFQKWPLCQLIMSIDGSLAEAPTKLCDRSAERDESLPSKNVTNM